MFKNVMLLVLFAMVSTGCSVPSQVNGIRFVQSPSYEIENTVIFVDLFNADFSLKTEESFSRRMSENGFHVKPFKEFYQAGKSLQYPSIVEKLKSYDIDTVILAERINPTKSWLNVFDKSSYKTSPFSNIQFTVYSLSEEAVVFFGEARIDYDPSLENRNVGAIVKTLHTALLRYQLIPPPVEEAAEPSPKSS